MKSDLYTMAALSDFYQCALQIQMDRRPPMTISELILLGHRIVQRHQIVPMPEWGPQLLKGLEDGRIDDLTRSQKRCLAWFSACALSGWVKDEDWSLGILSHSLEAARSVWIPGVWPSWMGPMPELGKRQLIQHMSDKEDAADPTGDPEGDALPPLQLERSSAWSWSSVGQVMDGLTLWPAILQDVTGLPFGDMQRYGQPDWSKLTPHQLHIITTTFRMAA